MYFQTTVPYRSNFTNGYMNTPLMSFHIAFCVQTKYVSCYQRSGLESSGGTADRLTAQRYHEVVQPVVPGLLEDLQRLWFHHDGATPHYGLMSGNGSTQHIQVGGLDVESRLYGLLGHCI
jgi:hypothetical protein